MWGWWITSQIDWNWRIEKKVSLPFALPADVMNFSASIVATSQWIGAKLVVAIYAIAKSRLLALRYKTQATQ